MPKIRYRASKIKLQRYICTYCKQSYTQKGTLNRHIKNNHTKLEETKVSSHKLFGVTIIFENLGDQSCNIVSIATAFKSHPLYHFAVTTYLPFSFTVTLNHSVSFCDFSF